MITTTHALISQAIVRRSPWRHAVWPALIGSILPDAFLGVFIAWFVATGVPAEQAWNEVYFTEPWVAIGAISNSFILWGLVTAAGAAWWLKSRSLRPSRWPVIIMVFGLSGLGHIAIDFLTHADDAHQHFWPISEWRFISPFSYWDPEHNSAFIMPIEGLITLVTSWVVWGDTKSRAAKALLVPLFLLGVLLILSPIVLAIIS